MRINRLVGRGSARIYVVASLVARGGLVTAGDEYDASPSARDTIDRVQIKAHWVFFKTIFTKSNKKFFQKNKKYQSKVRMHTLDVVRRTFKLHQLLKDSRTLLFFYFFFVSAEEL